MEEQMTESDEAWERRILCSDGNCIGVIGSDGRCKECGKPYTGDDPSLPPVDGVPPVDGETEDIDGLNGAVADPSADTIADDASAGTGDVTDADADDDWDARTLCIDESCIGVVGPDGRCKECGTPYPGINDHDRDTNH
jgi:hypothetical protein